MPANTEDGYYIPVSLNKQEGHRENVSQDLILFTGSEEFIAQVNYLLHRELCLQCDRERWTRLLRALSQHRKRVDGDNLMKELHAFIKKRRTLSFLLHEFGARGLATWGFRHHD